jgi:hypothetical protein
MTTQVQTTSSCSTQNDLLLNNLLIFFKQSDYAPLRKMLAVINGESNISLRIIDWFSTNYAKKYYTVYSYNAAAAAAAATISESEMHSTPPHHSHHTQHHRDRRFKVYTDYKLKLKAYSKKRFDPFCRWDRIDFPYKNNSSIQTTIGQLNFFKWAIENHVIHYIESNYAAIERDMNTRNSISKRKTESSSESSSSSSSSSTILSRCGGVGEGSSSISSSSISSSHNNNATRKKREELSILASSCIKKENVEIVVSFA